MPAGQQVQNIPLDLVRVLILITLDVVEAVLPAVPDPHIALEELETLEQHIIEINFPQRLFVLFVTSHDISEYLFIAAGRNIGIRIYIVVLDDGNLGHDGLGEFPGVVDPAEIPETAQEIVALILLRVEGVEGVRPLHPEDVEAERVDGHHRNGGRADAKQLLIFNFHFSGCGVGESDHEDPVRIDARLEHIVDPADKRCRLA